LSLADSEVGRVYGTRRILVVENSAGVYAMAAGDYEHKPGGSLKFKGSGGADKKKKWVACQCKILAA
jgi:hypothetical protein